jgi:exosortase E/protease (VPEID-CTERM system)
MKAQRENLPFSFVYLGGYLSCVAAEICIHAFSSSSVADFRFSVVADLALMAAYSLKVFFLALACVPFRTWIRMLRATSPLWLYASLAGVVAWFLLGPSQSLWSASDGASGSILQTATLHAVHSVLSFFRADSIVDVSTFTIGTPRFSIILGYGCAGVEGLGLVLVFTSIWLLYSRRECRFPQTLLLIPCALVCIWLLNVLRLCVLILIGDEVGPEVAMVGFHSRAGWITFTAVALAFCMATQKLSWVRKAPVSLSDAAEDPLSERSVTVTGALEKPDEQGGESPAIRAYLLPFLAILAASFVSKAASGYFEWLYPLRFIVAVIVLWYFLPELKKLNWRFGWIGPTTGVVVFLLWVAPSLWAHRTAISPLGPALGALSPAARWTWIAFRVAAAVLTVPIAEELAFRGYLVRRLISWDFDSVSFTRLTALSMGLSSVVFGLMHGQHWMVGILAGLAYALALRWRGRMGDAVVAHAVSNLLLAAWVLGFGDWAQW